LRRKLEHASADPDAPGFVSQEVERRLLASFAREARYRRRGAPRKRAFENAHCPAARLAGWSTIETRAASNTGISGFIGDMGLRYTW
jgi:hypothetical protein